MYLHDRFAVVMGSRSYNRKHLNTHHPVCLRSCERHDKLLEMLGIFLMPTTVILNEIVRNS